MLNFLWTLQCDALRDLVAFVRFKKLEKHPWRNITFSKVAGFSLVLAHFFKPGNLQLIKTDQNVCKRFESLYWDKSCDFSKFVFSQISKRLETCFLSSIISNSYGIFIASLLIHPSFLYMRSKIYSIIHANPLGHIKGIWQWVIH